MRSNGVSVILLAWCPLSIGRALCLKHLYLQCPGGSDGKADVYLQCGRPGFYPWIGKIPWRRKWQSTPGLLPGKSHVQRSLVGYSPWGCKESDTTERLHSTPLHIQDSAGEDPSESLGQQVDQISQS